MSYLYEELVRAAESGQTAYVLGYVLKYIPEERAGVMKLALNAAAEGGQCETVKALLRAGADPNGVPGRRRGFTAILEAAALGRTAVAVILLESGADPNKTGINGITALMAASGHWLTKFSGKDLSYSCHPEVAELLVLNGALLDAQDDKGDTALICTARTGCTCVAEVLLRAGAAVNVQNGYGSTALAVAVTRHNGPLVRLLLSYGADPLTPDRDGDTPISRARKGGPPEILSALLGELL